MNGEIYKLLSDNKPLPVGTRIICNTGKIEELTEVSLLSANRCPNSMSDYVPFWCFGWKDLHDRLLPAKTTG